MKLRRNRKVRPVIIPIGPSIAYVELTRGLHALIDSDDTERVGGHNWHAHRDGRTGAFYAKRNVEAADGSYGSETLHNYLVAPPAGLVADHVSGATLDYRRVNLRPATRSQNCMNSRMHPRNSSGFRGVYFSKAIGRWVARITAGGITRHIASFATKEEAGAAYRAAAEELHGEFRRVA